MKLGRNVALSLEILWSRWLRTALSILGIVLGVASVIVMVAAGQGAEAQVLGRIEAMGTNLIVVSAGQSRSVPGRSRGSGSITTLVPEDARAIAEDCPSVIEAAAVRQGSGSVRWQDRTVQVTILGMSPAGFGVRAYRAASGRLYDEREERAMSRVAVIGPTTARELFGDEEPVGRLVRIDRVPFEIVGVTARKGLDLGGTDQDDVVIVPLRTAMRRLFRVENVQTIYAQAAGIDALESGEREIRGLLRERHRLRDGPDDFTIRNQETLVATEREASRSMTTLISGVAGITLLVGGIGILAVMLISVRERTEEIGLRRALGARRRDIRTQFLLEAVLLSGAGGVLGVLVGIAGALAVSAAGSWPMLVSWRAVGLALLVAVGIGVFFGIDPARRAARLEPVTALRSE